MSQTDLSDVPCPGCGCMLSRSGGCAMCGDDWTANQLCVVEHERQRREEAERRLSKLTRRGEEVYAGSVVCGETIVVLEAAGCGRPGTPNTILAMTREIVARVEAAEAEVARLRVLARVGMELRKAVGDGDCGGYEGPPECIACGSWARDIKTRHEPDCPLIAFDHAAEGMEL